MAALDERGTKHVKLLHILGSINIIYEITFTQAFPN